MNNIARMGTQTLALQFLQDLRRNQNEIARAQGQISSGRRINTPSDDPVNMSVALELRRGIAAAERHRANADDALAWMSATEGALSNAIDLLQRARELAIQGANGSNTLEQREAIAEEIDQLGEAMVGVGNANLGGRFLFNGALTATAPFDAAGPTGVNTTDLTREIDRGETIAINVTADRLSGPGVGIVAVFSDLAADLRANDQAAISASLTEIDAQFDNVNTLRTEMGAKIARVELSIERYEREQIGVREQLSRIEDADLAESITNLTRSETGYQAALATGARIMPPSLIDFLG